MASHGDWNGLIQGTRADVPEVTVETVLRDRAPEGGSRPALVLGSDGNQYWMKTCNNPQGPRVPVNEFVVGRLGRLLGAPVCAVALLGIGEDIAGDRLADGRLLEPGLAHGSLNVVDASFDRALGHREKDTNAARQAYLYAMFDWCWGDDPQFLYAVQHDMETYSHDHGFYFPGGRNWTVAGLQGHADEPHPLNHPQTGLDASALERAARRLTAITRDDIAAVLGQVPASWAVGDDELEALGQFLDRRRLGVAQRLRDLIPPGEGGE